MKNSIGELNCKQSRNPARNNRAGKICACETDMKTFFKIQYVMTGMHTRPKDRHINQIFKSIEQTKLMEMLQLVQCSDPLDHVFRAKAPNVSFTEITTSLYRK